MAQISLKKAEMKIKDGTTPTANSITVKFGEGNLTYSRKRNIEYKLNRGNIDEVREGDDVPLEVSFEGLWEFITADTGDPPTIVDALEQAGEASAWASSDSDACRPYAVDLEVTYDPGCSGVKKEILLFPDFRFESYDPDLKAGQISVKGKCNAVKPTATRTS